VTSFCYFPRKMPRSSISTADQEQSTIRSRRTAVACIKCRERKSKCSGEHPTCQRCSQRGLVCEYVERISRGRSSGNNSPTECRSTQSPFLHPSNPLESSSLRTHSNDHRSRVSEQTTQYDLELSSFFDPSSASSFLARQITSADASPLSNFNSAPPLDGVTFASDDSLHLPPPSNYGISTLPYTGLTYSPVAPRYGLMTDPENIAWKSLADVDEPPVFPPISGSGSPLEGSILFQPLTRAPSL